MGWGQSPTSATPAVAQAADQPLRKIGRLLHFHGKPLDGGAQLSLVSNQLNEHQVLVILDTFLPTQLVLSLEILLFSGCRLCCQAVVEYSQHQGSGCRATLNLIMAPDQRQLWVRYLDKLV